MRRASRWYRLLRDGTAATGRIESVAELGEGRRRRYKLAYTFGAARTPAERTLTPRKLHRLGLARAPRTGDALVVVHDPRRLARHVIWGIRA